MNIKATLEYISVENKYRREHITNILTKNKIPYKLETTNSKEYINIIINNNKFINPNMKVLLSAHYDSVNKSKGANDNGAAVAMLLQIAEYAKTHTSYCPIEIALFDREESGFVGSLAYINKQHDKPIFFINCDVIGCGDGIVMVKHDKSTYYPTASNILTNQFMQKYQITEYSSFPPSDAYNLAHRAKWNGIEFSVFPQNDINNNSCLDIFKYMHNAIYDDIKYINFSIIETLYNAILELLFP